MCKEEIKSVTTFKPREGVKNYIVRWKDDSISIKSLFLVDEKFKDSDDALLTKKFGKYLYMRVTGRLSHVTLDAINHILNQELPKDTITRQVLKRKIK